MLLKIHPFALHTSPLSVLTFQSRSCWLSLSLILRPTASWPVCLGIKHPSGAYDQIFIAVGQLLVCWCGALSLTRGRFCRLQLLALANAVILRSKSRGTRDHILLSQILAFPFRRSPSVAFSPLLSSVVGRSRRHLLGRVLICVSDVTAFSILATSALSRERAFILRQQADSISSPLVAAGTALI
jgi:hypothetical protein